MSQPSRQMSRDQGVICTGSPLWTRLASLSMFSLERAIQPAVQSPGLCSGCSPWIMTKPPSGVFHGGRRPSRAAGADTQASERGNGDFPTRAAHVGGGRVAQTQSRMKAALAIDGDDAIASLGRTPVAFPHLGPVRAEAQRNGAGEHGFAGFAVHKRQTARGFFNQNHGFVMCAAWTPP